jgi:crotonobetainyl-CoA:carnitine CoA-transferase CaiB-like acyl-CoA transferase
MTLEASGRALEGVRVLDLSRVLAGPWCAQILADFGADVIKIEQPGSGDDTRAWGPPYLQGPDDADRGESAYYLSCNRNKRSLAIDLANPEGAALAQRLAGRADILIENFKVGGLAKYGLDHQSLAAANPRLVYCSITGFGQDGPYASRPGYDFVAQAMGGLMSITGEPDGPPQKVGVAIADLSTGLYAAISILIALRHAERTGVGQRIDCSLLDTQIALLANQGMNWLVSGASPGRLGNAHPSIVPYRAFEAADGPVVVAVGNDGQFRGLCEVLDAPQLAADPRYRTNEARVLNRASLEPALQAMIARLQARPLTEQLIARGVPAGPVNTIGQVFQDPFVEARSTIHRFLRPDGVEVPSIAFPGRLTGTPADYRLRPPFLGEHTFEVLDEWLGLERPELLRLADAGAISDRSAS